MPLRAWIERLWAVEERGGRGDRREHVLPTGAMHVVIRLREDPLRIFTGPQDRVGTLVGQALVGGARDPFYTREVPGPQCSVGARLRPGAAEALFGTAADEFAYRHTSVADIWGAAAGSLCDRLTGMPLEA